MHENHEEHHTPEHKQNWWLTWPGIVCAVILTTIVYTLIIDHREHLEENWILILFLLCPAMHLFMHHGHDHHHPPDDKEEED